MNKEIGYNLALDWEYFLIKIDKFSGLKSKGSLIIKATEIAYSKDSMDLSTRIKKVIRILKRNKRNLVHYLLFLENLESKLITIENERFYDNIDIWKDLYITVNGLINLVYRKKQF